MAHSRQKSYTYVRIRELDFEVYDWVYLNVLQMISCSLVRRANLVPRILDLQEYPI